MPAWKIASCLQGTQVRVGVGRAPRGVV